MEERSEKKSLKQLAFEAKTRLSNGYWQKYYANLSEARNAGSNAATSKIVSYYETTAKNEIHKGGIDEEFYLKVKKFLDEHGEAGNAIGYLTDREYFNSLDYDQQQRYNLELSKNYRLAVERYYAEKEIENMRKNKV